MISRQKEIINKSKKDHINAIPKAPFKMFIARFFSCGNIKANSYLPLPNTANIPTKEVNIAYCPTISGVKRREKIGIVKMPTPCAIVVEPAILKTLKKKSFPNDITNSNTSTSEFSLYTFPSHPPTPRYHKSTT